MPRPTTEDDRSRDQAHLLHSLHRREAQTQAYVWVRGHGAVLVEQDGK